MGSRFKPSTFVPIFKLCTAGPMATTCPQKSAAILGDDVNSAVGLSMLKISLKFRPEA